MWKLTIEDDEGKQTSLPLAHDEYALGRAEANSIRLTDRNISRKHAVLSKNGQGWLVRDNDSYNGTFVNGVRVVGEQHLRHGDLVQLGDYRLELVDESLLQAPSPAPAGRGTTLSPLHTRPDRLVMIVGPTPGAEFALDGDRLHIGRSEECRISINHSSVSRTHAELIKIDKGRYEVIDLASANGIRINGVELKRGLLEAGDALELGDVRLRFVGAGKIFRPVETTQYPVVTPGSAERGGQGPASGRERGGAWKVVALIALVLAIAAAAAFFMTRKPAGHQDRNVESVPAEMQEDQDRARLREAKAALDANQIDKAHELVEGIADTSAVREDPVFKAIEARWADAQFDKAAKAGITNEAKFDILARVASTSSVDRDKRDRAIQMLEELKNQDPNLDQRKVPPRPPQRPEPVPGGGVAQPTPTPVPVPPASTPTKVSDSAPAPLDTSGYAAQRKALEPKVWSGKASPEEIKLLRAICSHIGDRACRDRASAMLKAKEKELAGQ